jgi:HPt (histidine-containing phosphotransfer) domain-containing protein
MGSVEQSSIVEAMNRLWAQFLPQIEERVKILETAARALDNGTLTGEQSEQAAAAAHKLAGVLGTFGLAKGTDLSREAEAFYSAPVTVNICSHGRLAEIASQLRVMLATRK